MSLRPETVERVSAYWRGWAGEQVTTNAVGLVVIGNERFLSAPDRLRDRLSDVPGELDALVHALGADIERVGGEARLAYADEATLRPVVTRGVTDIMDGDTRLDALEAASEPVEWTEASADEACDRRVGVVEREALLAVGILQVWDDLLGQIGVFTAADARGSRSAGRVGSAIAQHALASSLIPQWRSRIGLDASARVADKLGFVALGRQVFVRVNADT